MAKKTISGVNVGLVGESTVNFIKQIYDGSTNHDLALTKGISFFNGNDGDAIVWDGTQAIEVVIPSVTDIIQDPVRMVGTVGSDGNLPSGLTPAKGDLVYMTADCTFQGVACEAGDMAIYDGSAWHVISGENQVSLAGGTTDASGNHAVVLTDSATKVLDVEGKELTLAVDYSGIYGNITATGNPATTISVLNGTVDVDGQFITLSYAAGTEETISTPVSISLPYALASDAVSIDQSVLEASDFSWNAGTLPSASKNAGAIAVTTSNDLAVSASADNSGDFVIGVTAIQGVSFVQGSAIDKSLTYVSGLSATSGKSFISSIHVHTAEDGDTPADLTLPGAVTFDSAANTFITGLSDTEAASGDVVSSVTVNTSDDDFLTGLSGGGNTVITGVTFGDTQIDTTGNKDWFVTGLADDAAAVTAVSFGEVVVTPSTSNAIVSASVSNHVLSFTTGSFVTSASASLSGTGVTTKAFTFGGVALTGFSSSSDTFTSGSALTSASAAVSFKDFVESPISLTQGTTGLHFSKEASAAYEALYDYAKFSLTEASVSMGKATLSGDITANIPADSVVVGISAGTLPSWSVGDATGTLTGKVDDTSLSTSEVSWLGVAPSKNKITGAGTYTLVSTATSGEGVIEVAVADTYDVEDATVTISANAFVDDVKINRTSIVTPVNNG